MKVNIDWLTLSFEGKDSNLKDFNMQLDLTDVEAYIIYPQTSSDSSLTIPFTLTRFSSKTSN